MRLQDRSSLSRRSVARASRPATNDRRLHGRGVGEDQGARAARRARRPTIRTTIDDQDDDDREARPDAVLRQGRRRGDHGRGAFGRRGRDPQGRLRELPRHARTSPIRTSRRRRPRIGTNGGPRAVARAQLAGDQHRPDGQPALVRVDPVGGPLRLDDRARRGRVGHVRDAAGAGSLPVHEVQGRIQRGLPGHAARRPAGAAHDRSGQRLSRDRRRGGHRRGRRARSR